MFLLIESAGRRRASLHWVLRASSPASAVLSSATTSYRPSRRPLTTNTVFPSLGSTSGALVISLPDGRVRRRGLELVSRFSSREITEETDRGFPKFLGNHCTASTCSNPTPAGLLAPDHIGAATWPLVSQMQRLPRWVFRRRVAWLSNSLRAPCLMHGQITHTSRYPGYPDAPIRGMPISGLMAASVMF